MHIYICTCVYAYTHTQNVYIIWIKIDDIQFDSLLCFDIEHFNLRDEIVN